MTGAFLEGRYKVAPIHDERQLLTTLAYIDLNPFAANVCKKPKDGRYTSLQGRLDRDKPLPVKEVRPGYESRGKKEDSVASARGKPVGQETPVSVSYRQKFGRATEVRGPSSVWLFPMDAEYLSKHRSKTTSAGRSRTNEKRHAVLPGLTVRVYLKLVDYVARLMRGGKKRLAGEVKPVLERLSLTCDDVMAGIGSLRKQWALLVPQETTV